MAPSGVFAGWHCSTSPTGAVKEEEEEEKPTTNLDAVFPVFYDFTLQFLPYKKEILT